MALTAQEEALVRQLLEEQAAILSLANSEATILSKLGATKVTLSGLAAVSTVADADLLLMRQGTTDRSVSAALLGAYASALVPAASETVQGKIEIANAAESQALTDLVRALTPGRLASAFQGSNQSLITNGYQRFPGGLILQWATGASSTAGEATEIVTFPIAFPNQCLMAMTGTLVPSGAVPADTWYQTISFTVSQVNVLRNQSAVNAFAASPLVIAIGR